MLTPMVSLLSAPNLTVCGLNKGPGEKQGFAELLGMLAACLPSQNVDGQVDNEVSAQDKENRDVERQTALFPAVALPLMPEGQELPREEKKVFEEKLAPSFAEQNADLPVGLGSVSVTMAPQAFAPKDNGAVVSVPLPPAALSPREGQIREVSLGAPLPEDLGIPPESHQEGQRDGAASDSPKALGAGLKLPFSELLRMPQPETQIPVLPEVGLPVSKDNSAASQAPANFTLKLGVTSPIEAELSLALAMQESEADETEADPGFFPKKKVEAPIPTFALSPKAEGPQPLVNPERQILLPLRDLQTLVARARVQEGEVQTLTLQLKPEKLGTLRIAVALEEGEIVAKLYTETREAQSALTQSLSRLQDNLAEAGIKVQRCEVVLSPQVESEGFVFAATSDFTGEARHQAKSNWFTLEPQSPQNKGEAEVFSTKGEYTLTWTQVDYLA